jgi:hypothetical protein
LMILRSARSLFFDLATVLECGIVSYVGVHGPEGKSRTW